MDQIAHGRPRCSNDDVALKSFFLGPQAENKDWVQYQVFHIFKSYFEWRMKVHPEDGRAISGGDQAVAEFKAQKVTACGIGKRRNPPVSSSLVTYHLRKLKDPQIEEILQ